MYTISREKLAPFSVHVVVVLCDMFVVTHKGDLSHLRPLHTQIFQVKEH